MILLMVKSMAKFIMYVTRFVYECSYNGKIQASKEYIYHIIHIVSHVALKGSYNSCMQIHLLWQIEFLCSVFQN